MFNKNLIVLVLLTLFSTSTISQITFYQDVFYGGVTGDGINPFVLETTENFDIYIEPGSTIRKAYLFISVVSVDSSVVIDNSLIFNGQNINLSINSALNNNYFSIPYWSLNIEYRTLAIDVTDLIDPLTNSYPLTSPNNQISSGENGIFSNYYLYVTYDNPSLNKVNAMVIVNNQDAQQLLSYSFNNSNPKNLVNDVGFTFNAEAICDTFVGIQDGSYVYVNNTLIGLVGGDENNFEPGCTGVRGAFYYQNNTVFGLDNDTPDVLMDGPECLASIESYLTDPYNLNIEFDYQINGDNGNKSNPISELFLTYTTTCDTFSISVPNDTTVCKNTQLQLNVSGGQTYEWIPATGLSCSTCPNPVFTADSTMNYTVRIWNNDTCSVVRPLKINVSPLPTFSNIVVTPSTCGTTNGKVILTASSSGSGTSQFTMNGGTPQPTGTFNTLAQGNYTFTLTDALGCVSEDTVVAVGVVNPTIASFNLSPTYGMVPLLVSATNTSQNATNFSWSINGASQGSSLSPQTLENAGTYIFELVAWKFDSSCADTAFRTVLVLGKVVIPTAFTPSTDGVNDFWELQNLDEQFPKNTVQVFNQWGSLIYESTEGKYAQRQWDGYFKGEKLPVGSYYYVIEVNDGETKAFVGSVTIILE